MAQLSMTRGRLPILLLTLGLLLGLTSLAPAPASASGWREYSSGGRQWRERCDAYSSSVTRCRVEIRATVASWNGRRFVTNQGWMFNNLVYRPSPRAQWAGNPLATPGDHTIEGRQWRTEPVRVPRRSAGVLRGLADTDAGLRWIIDHRAGKFGKHVAGPVGRGRHALVPGRWAPGRHREVDAAGRRTRC